jgi:predicted transcriptional regulator
LISGIAVHIIVHMNTRFELAFRDAVRHATATLGEIAEGIGRTRRTLMAYMSDDPRHGRRVPREAVQDLIQYLRTRAAAFNATANELEQELEQDASDE